MVEGIDDRGIAGTDVCQCSSYVYGDEAVSGKGFDQEVNRCCNLVGHVRMHWHYDSGDMMVEGIGDLFHEMASQVRMCVASQVRMCASVAAMCMVMRLLVVRDSTKKSIVAVT
jgi:hypothetical protein